MQVQIGSSSVVEMNDREAAEAMRKHFAAHGMDFKAVRVCDDGEIQFETPDGAKVILRPGFGGDCEIALC